MDAPVYKKLVDLDNRHENPFATKEGQIAISINETWQSRLARLGLIKNIYSSSGGITLTQGSMTTLYTSQGQGLRAGYNIIPLKIIISSTSSGFAQFQYQTDYVTNQMYIQRYLGQSGAWDFDPNGLIVIGDPTTTTFTAQFKADNASAVGWFNMLYAEVAI